MTRAAIAAENQILMFKGGANVYCQNNRNQSIFCTEF